MREFIQEQNVWETLQEENKPIILYGMGLGAEKIMDTLATYGVAVSDIFASDEFVRGHSFRGYKVLTYKEVCEKYEDFNVVLCFATRRKEVLETIGNIHAQHHVFAPDVPIAGGGLFSLEFLETHEPQFDAVYQQLADEESRRVYLDVIRFKISGKIDYLLRSFCDKDAVYRDILQLNGQESILDLGAYDGDTIREFLTATNGAYGDITALEPDKKNFKKLQKNTQHLARLSLLNMGAWNQRDSLIFSDKAGRNSRLSAEGNSVAVTDVDALHLAPTFIKMDIEGSELKALEGAEQTIRQYLPKLYICAYHRNEDLFTLPMKVLALHADYKLYFRHSPYIPAWESNFYCIP